MASEIIIHRKSLLAKISLEGRNRRGNRWILSYIEGEIDGFYHIYIYFFFFFLSYIFFSLRESSLDSIGVGNANVTVLFPQR